jgi:hypothetical protein
LEARDLELLKVKWINVNRQIDYSTLACGDGTGYVGGEW